MDGLYGLRCKGDSLSAAEKEPPLPSRGERRRPNQFRKAPHPLVDIAATAAIVSIILGRILFLSSRAEVVRLGAILFAISFAILITLIHAIRRKD